MKKIIYIIISVSIIAIFSKCKTSIKSLDVTYYKDSLQLNDAFDAVKITALKGKEFNHPTFVIWKESLQGDYIETLFITKSYATGIFGHASMSESTWSNQPGESLQPSALPYWTNKKGLIDNAVLVPNMKHPFTDAYTGATPKGDFTFETNTENETSYKILLEVNQAWDWNNYWTNNKFPESEAYKHSAQPSLIYAVTINKTDNSYTMNPVGHGDPKGESGKLITDISTLTGAKEIFKTIKIETE